MDKKFFDGIEKAERITGLIDDLYKDKPEIEPYRAELITESFKATENQPLIIRKALAFKNILENIPVVIRDNELIVGSNSVKPRSCQTFPEFSFDWLESEFDTVANRTADPFYISEQTKSAIKEADKYWKGKTTSELATAYMTKQTKDAINHNIFTPGNYFYNGIGHVTVKYREVLEKGLNGIILRADEELKSVDVGYADYAGKSAFLKAVIISLQAVIIYSNRYSALAREKALTESDAKRKAELIKISEVCAKVPAQKADNFYEACQSFWFIQQLLQLESSGHSISPGRFDQYMYPYFKKDIDGGKITAEQAQELIDCVFVKLNDLNKCRDAQSAEGFAGYSLFQNMIVGGQTEEGADATNELSYMCFEAAMHVRLPQPSLSIRVWNGSPHNLLIKAAALTRTGIGLPAYYNDEVIIPSLMSRGLTMEDARDYNIIGCVEPQKAGKTDGWHDAAFFNMCRPLELVFSNGRDKGELIGVETGEVENLKTFDDFYNAYKKQMNYMIGLLVNADNSIDKAHAERCPLPFESSLVDDCIVRGKSLQEGGAVYNFTGPQGFGIANMTDSLYAIRKLVYEEKKFTITELKEALDNNFGYENDDSIKSLVSETVKNLSDKGVRISDTVIDSVAKNIAGLKSGGNKEKYKKIREEILALDKYGNDNEEIDSFARDVEYTYAKPILNYRNPRGGTFQAGLYPVSANVPLGAQTGATPDGRLAGKPVADGVSPSAGKDTHGPTAAANSVSHLDHFITSNGTLFNQKFHPSALEGRNGLENFVALIQSFFDKKGSHMQFNVVSRETLLDAQKNPENYQHLVVRVAGYSALFTTLSKSLQDDIINRTEQGF